MEIPGYALGRLLGSGVYSNVYLACKPRCSPVAVKALKNDFRNDAWVLQCFRREGHVGRTVKHPSLVSIQTQSPFYHICKVAEGQTLRDAALLPRSIVLHVIEQIASALAALHRAGYLHGDVKPGNIMLAPNGHATLIDLGFARRPGSLLSFEALPGTPNYLAPELCGRNFVDTPAADVFALGVTAFELLTGKLPYPRRELNEDVLEQHRTTEPAAIHEVDPALPAWVAKLVDGMLVTDLFDRCKAERISTALKTCRLDRAA